MTTVKPMPISVRASGDSVPPVNWVWMYPTSVAIMATITPGYTQ